MYIKKSVDLKSNYYKLNRKSCIQRAKKYYLKHQDYIKNYNRNYYFLNHIRVNTQRNKRIIKTKSKPKPKPKALVKINTKTLIKANIRSKIMEESKNYILGDNPNDFILFKSGI